jgi:hypothetical protein
MQAVPMRSGFEPVEQPVELTEFHQNVAGIVAELLSAAMRAADRYRGLANRDGIHPKDLTMGIMANVVEGRYAPSCCRSGHATLFLVRACVCKA